MFSKITVNVR